ncbi:hypothetical protein [Geomicrobium sp. JCM 19055]|uniref:hypothetical protein n=1 Tax=Geomicrobium sp. JCM 19055 TaxID=1460649 RepID=UPI00045EDCC9|nr:hypothetical protein [Geomicrobium sp. JCM 19055]GAK00878.1 hypothetical protein JCM19055_3999 [Geomicrobium sp. JCM 19055]
MAMSKEEKRIKELEELLDRYKNLSDKKENEIHELSKTLNNVETESRQYQRELVAIHDLHNAFVQQIIDSFSLLNLRVVQGADLNGKEEEG